MPPQSRKNPKWRRDPHPYEEHVNFAQLDDEMTSMEKRFVRAARPLVGRLTRRAGAKLKRHTSGQLRLFTLADQVPYQELYFDYAEDNTKRFGRITAEELKTTFALNEGLLELFKNQAGVIIKTHLDNVTSSIRKRIGILDEYNQEEATRLTATVSGLLDSGSSSIGSVMVATSISEVRRDMFGESAEDISRYLYSAILDGRTCPICEDLDGMTLTAENYNKTPWLTPTHHRCRCIWVAILKEQTVKPNLTSPKGVAGGKKSPPFADWLQKNGLTYG